MKKEDIDQRTKRRFGGALPVAAVAVVAVVLGGCSSVPDAVNPVKWYESTVDYFSGDKEKKDEANKAQTPGTDKAFPKLATVPEKPQVSSAEERDKIAQGLVGDREGRRYASEVPHQGAPIHVLGGENPAAKGKAQAGMPSPVPTLPTASAPVPGEMPKTTASSTMPVTPSALSPTSPPPPPSLTYAPPAPAITQKAPMMAQAMNVPPLAVGPDSFETVVVSSSGINEEANVSSQGEPKDSRAVLRYGTAAHRSDDRNGSIKVATIQFANGSAKLDVRDRAILREVVALQRERGGTIRVIGHASSRTLNMDPVRHKLVNYDVSSARAEVVAKTLGNLGARTKDVVVVAKSDTDPLYYEFMPSGEAGNRRTEVYLDF